MAGFAGLFSLAQLPALISALNEDDRSELAPFAGFATSIAIGLAVSGLLWLVGRRDRSQIFRRETIAVAGLSWFLAGAIGAVPFWVSGLLSPVDAYFEAVSGLTTCGATSLGSGGNLEIEAVPPSLLLWRAMLQWIGGAGIVLLFVALLPAVGVSAKNLLSSESIGVATESYQPRARAKARTTTSTASASGVGRSSHISTFLISSKSRHISDKAPARANATSMDVAATLSTDNVGESRSDRKACRQPSRSPRRALARKAMVYVAQSGGAHVLGSRSARSNNLSAALNFALRSLATGAS